MTSTGQRPDPGQLPMWTAINDFRIEKSRLPVVLITLDGERLSGDLFVQPTSQRRAGSESAPDVLNSAERWFPLATMDGETRLVSKAQVRELFVAREDADEPEWDIGARASVELTLMGGHVHTGTMFIEQESARSRVLDFLNRYRERFLPLYREDGVVLINCSRITWVRQEL
ncbi:MAG: hypothetical protein ACT4OZ_16540 [Gemmatimonadota bacterium]